MIDRTHPRPSVLALLLGAMLLALLTACGDEPPEVSSDAPAAATARTDNETSEAQPSQANRKRLPGEKSYTSPELAFSVAYPGAWKVNERNAEEEGVVIENPETGTTFWVQRHTFGGNADDANQAGIDFLKDINESYDDAEALEYNDDPQEYDLSGLTALATDYQYTQVSDGVEVAGRLLVVTTPDGETYMLMIEAAADVLADEGELLDSMVESFTVSGAAPADPAEPGQVTAPPTDREEAEWLLMFYLDADDETLERDIMIDLNELERVGSTSDIHIVAQVDRYKGAFKGMDDWTGTKRFYITQDQDLAQIGSNEVADLGEVNMADGQTLVDFVTWALINYPARKHVLILSDHGAGWPGGYQDPDPGGPGIHDFELTESFDDSLWLVEIDEALDEIRAKTGLDKFELIGFDACLMGMLEVYTMLAPHGRYAVASEELEPALGWAYTHILTELAANPSMDGAELGRIIVSSYIDQDQRIVDDSARRQFLRESESDEDPGAEAVAEEYGVDITLAAIDLSALAALNQALGELTPLMLGMDRKQVNEARATARSFDNIFDPDLPSPYIDLGHFIKKISSRGDTDTQAAADAVLEALDQAVLITRHGPERQGASGIAIYFPTRKLYHQSDTNWNYADIALRFAQESDWDDFLDAFFDGGSRAGRGGAISRSQPVDASLKPLTVEPLQLSAELTAPGEPVNIQTEVSGDNLAFVYSFIGRLLPDENMLVIEDMDYIFSDETEEVDGVAAPVWPPEGVIVDFDWEPIIYAINDGTTSVRALFAPDTYGETPTYVVEGTYTFAESGDTRFARLYFSDGEMTKAFGYTGQDGTGAPHEITPTAGDRFTVLEQLISLADDASEELTTRPAGTLTFGPQTFTIEEIPAPSGSYSVGIIAEDLEGEQTEQFEALFVENSDAVAIEGTRPYTSEALGVALLQPEAWESSEDPTDETLTFTADDGTAQLIIARSSYPDAATPQEANEQAIDEVIAALETDGDLEALTFVTEIEDTFLGAFSARGVDFTFTLDGVPFSSSLTVATPAQGTTYTVLALAPDEAYDAASENFGVILDSFDILISGVNKEQDGPPPPAQASTILDDDLSSAASGLPAIDDQMGTGSYTADGNYTLDLVPFGGPLYTTYAGQTLPSDFLIETQASYTGSDNNGYGLIFRATDDTHFYAFQISGDGYYTIDRANGDELVTLLDWTPSALIDTTPGAPNTITVQGNGQSYHLYINGRRVHTFEDTAYTSGTAGLIADNYDDTAPTTLVFDSYTIGTPAP